MSSNLFRRCVEQLSTRTRLGKRVRNSNRRFAEQLSRRSHLSKRVWKPFVFFDTIVRGCRIPWPCHRTSKVTQSSPRLPFKDRWRRGARRAGLERGHAPFRKRPTIKLERRSAATRVVREIRGGRDAGIPHQAVVGDVVLDNSVNDLEGMSVRAAAPNHGRAGCFF